MNRAFWIIAVPAALVAAAYLGVGWGLTVPVSVGIGAVVVAGVAAAIWRKRRATTDEHG